MHNVNANLRELSLGPKYGGLDIDIRVAAPCPVVGLEVGRRGRGGDAMCGCWAIHAMWLCRAEARARSRLHNSTDNMDQQQEPPEFILDVFADPRSVRDVVKGKFVLLIVILPWTNTPLPRILHTIFFNRFFPSLTPQTREVLDTTLPYVNDDELETMIDQRVAALERQIDSQRSSGGANNAGSGSGNGGRGQLVVQFFEKRRRKAWLSRGDEEVCWECWTIKVTVAEPRTESGTEISFDDTRASNALMLWEERAKVRRAMEQTLTATAMKIVTFVNTHKDHIPPITTQGTNPFPYKINLDQKEATSWATRMRIY
ncbi:hypothetical protein F53441_12963 [Fusarium austroafricanum]|uniref:Autophagy-related protein 101 n=1 Tax=Fusarium austroafricanum TaxID=2364996 RepID=A0A8H4JVS5_9HYPO|nr:hypothetical protein F53441_12963 [Fusarium austroafricanum]